MYLWSDYHKVPIYMMHIIGKYWKKIILQPEKFKFHMRFKMYIIY